MLMKICKKKKVSMRINFKMMMKKMIMVHKSKVTEETLSITLTLTRWSRTSKTFAKTRCLHSKRSITSLWLISMTMYTTMCSESALTPLMIWWRKVPLEISCSANWESRSMSKSYPYVNKLWERVRSRLSMMNSIAFCLSWTLEPFHFLYQR